MKVESTGLPDTLLICGIVFALYCVYPGLQALGRVGVIVRLKVAGLTGGKWSLLQPLAHPLEVRTTGRSRSSRESHGLHTEGYKGAHKSRSDGSGKIYL